MTANIEAEINRAARLGTQLEHLVYNKSKEGKLVAIGKNDDLLMGYWSLVFDFGKGIGCLLHHEFYSAAFALFRPIVEALVRAGVVLARTPEDVQRIRKDQFTVNFKKDGAWIDKALGLGTLMDDFLRENRELLHSLTHSGTAPARNAVRWLPDRRECLRFSNSSAAWGCIKRGLPNDHCGRQAFQVRRCGERREQGVLGLWEAEHGVSWREPALVPRA